MADRIEREIEEILRKIDDFVPERTRRARPQQRKAQPFAVAQGWIGHSLARVSLSQVWMWALFVFIVTFFLRAVPGATWVMVASLLVFVTAFAFSRRGGGRSQPQMRWRGEPLDLSDPPWPDRLKAWLKGRRRA